MKSTFKIRGLRLTVDDTTSFSFPDENDECMMQVGGTFAVKKKLRNGNYAAVSKQQVKKVATSIIRRATIHAKNLIRVKENARN